MANSPTRPASPVFLRRLRDSPAPVATVILTVDDGEVARMVASHPGSDFLLPERFAGKLETHRVIRSGGRLLLLSLAARQAPSNRPCAL